MRLLRTKYESLIEVAPDAIFLVDMDEGHIVEANHRAGELLGRNHETLVDQPVTAVHPPEDTDLYRAQFDRTVAQGSTQFDTLPDGSQAYVRRGDGERVPVEIHARSVELEGSPYVYSIVRDVTSRLERQRELERQNERLARFADLVAHDLRNPLTVAEGYLELLGETGDSDHYEQVADAHQQMRDIVADLLDLAKRGRSVVDAERVPLADVVCDVWGRLECPDATLEVVDSRVVCADSSQLTQLVENLLRNALRHCDDAVTVRVGTLDDGFYLADDGPGISDADVEQVFEPGYTTAEDGTGFGLVVVREIADAHGWRVEVSESDADGARFAFKDVEFDD